jgi:hypothetical protein
MKSNSKDRMVVSLIAVVFFVTVCGLGYMLFGKHNPTGMFTSYTRIVKVDNLQQIELYKKYTTVYAIKIQENNKFFLEYHGYESNVPYENKFDLTADQYNKIVEGNDYWFQVKYSKTGSETDGSIKKIYTEDPMRR